MKIALISTRLKSATTLTEELLSNSLFVIVSIHELRAAVAVGRNVGCCMEIIRNSRKSTTKAFVRWRRGNADDDALAPANMLSLCLVTD